MDEDDDYLLTCTWWNLLPLAVHIYYTKSTPIVVYDRGMASHSEACLASQQSAGWYKVLQSTQSVEPAQHEVPW